MADILKMITANRYIDGEEKTCYYLGTYQTDGWIYFNDDRFWRHNPDYDITQTLYLSKEIWVDTTILNIQSISNLNGTQVQNMTNGAGSVAPNANIETAVQWAIKKATNEYISYSNYDRNVKNPNGTSYDCSSFVITAMYVGGFDADFSSPRYANTEYMKDAFTEIGFEWLPGAYWPAKDLIRGDIQLKINPYDNGHTNIYIGNNQDVDCGDEPCAIFTHTPDNWNRGGWDGILRYPS